MIIACIVISILFVVHMLYLLFRMLEKHNSYNHNVDFQGGKTVGSDDNTRKKLLLYESTDKNDTVVMGMKVPSAPVTSSFAGLLLRISHVNTGQLFDFYLENQLVIGRIGGSAAVQIDDAMVSGKHCMIYRKGEQIFIQDLDSTNHTYLNGCLLESPMPICTGDLINIGKSMLQFQFLYMNN